MTEDVIVNRKWLLNNDFSRHAIDNLVKSNQLKSISKGVYVRNPNNITWQSVVYSLQSIFKTDLIPGGLTSLELHGLSHYLSFSENKNVHLYGKNMLPKWINDISQNVTFVRHNTNKVFGKTLDNSIKSCKNKQSQPYVAEKQWYNNKGKLIVSTPERAYLEILSDIPEKITFEHADQIMQGLTILSPRILQQILEDCKNIKVKRLFFWFADRYNYAWLSKIDREKIFLGRGNRMIIKGGKLDKKYKITVPEWI